MKHLLTLPILLLTVLFSYATIAQVNQGLIGYYTFSGNANDSSGNDNHGFVTGATLTSDRFGRPNSAYHFGSGLDKIELHAGTIGMTVGVERTISVWIKPDTILTAEHTHVINHYLMFDTYVSNFFFSIVKTAGFFKFRATGIGVDVLDGVFSFDPTDKWSHIVLIMKDGMSNTRIYVNASISAIGQVTYNDFISPLTPVIGNIYDLLDPQIHHFVGAIDDLRIYDRVLSESEIDTLYGDYQANYVDDDSKIFPQIYCLDQNYPNPFNPNTKIKYSVPQVSQVQIKVFDVLGNEIETLVNEEKQIGTYELTWSVEGFSSGVYFYQLKAGDYTSVRKMILLK